jgi:alpha,alpha-trehalose phosphorylase
VGYDELALRYFMGALFVDLADLHHNSTDGVHVASTGGVWSALVYGFGGFRDHGGHFSLDPRLPEPWPSMTFRVTLHGNRVRVTLRSDELELALEEGDEVTIDVRGESVTVTADAPATVQLKNQGPRLTGRPEPVAGRRRADGSIIGAIVPGA